MIHKDFEICGCDASHWQKSLNFDTLIASGLKFIIIRSSRDAFPDLVYPQHLAGAIEHNFPHGAYHYWQPISSAAKNAEAMIKAVKCCPPVGWWIDIESAAGTLTVRQSTLHILETVKRLDDYFGGYTGLYASQSSWRRLIDPALYHDFDLGKRPLWVANYLKIFRAKPLSIPDGWTHYDIWQFSAESGPYAGKGKSLGASSTHLDIDAFNGSEIEFLEFTGHEVIEPPDEPPEPPKPPAPPVIPLALTGYRVAHDREKGKLWRVKQTPVPEIFWMKDEPIPLTKPLQKLIYDMNQPGMSKKQFRTFLGKRTAVANSAGFDDNDKRADFINGVDLDKPLPKLGKTYTFGGANLHGKIEGDYLTVETIDVTKHIPEWSEIKGKPWLYTRCWIVDKSGKTFDFPYRNGAPVYFPLVSVGPVKIKLNQNVEDKPIPYVKRI